MSTADPISLVMKRSLFRSSTKKGIVTTTKFARETGRGSPWFSNREGIMSFHPGVHFIHYELKKKSKAD